MKKLEEADLVRLEITVGVDTHTIHGKVIVCAFYEPLIQEINSLDFAILRGEENLMVMKLDEIFGLGEGMPEEVLLPGDLGYEEVG